MCEKCTGTGHDWDHCEVEKMGCPGCDHYKKEKQISRKLASIQKIKAVKPIDGADRIECVQVLNWDCVVKKGEYNVGDMIVYFEIDSLLPDIPSLNWLKGSSWSQKLNKYKISTHKFKNQISQGLVVPISQVVEIYDQINPDYADVALPEEIMNPTEGTDLTELLKIEKYEPPVSNGSLGEVINHEWYVPKTDEERIQVCAQDVLPKYIESPRDGWYASIKLDGTSCTAGLFDDAFLIGGRNQWYKGPNMYTETVNKYGDLEAKCKEYLEVNGEYVVFQGELCGPGIQSNRLGLKEKEWFIFNVFTSKTGTYDSYTKCDVDTMIEICADFGLRVVPMVADYNKYIFEDMPIDTIVEELLQHADTFKYRSYFEDASPSQIAEGLVFRMNDMSYSFKVVSNKFLLKGGE
jgi:RNA ligase (TIGR02306 family)